MSDEFFDDEQELMEAAMSPAQDGDGAKVRRDSASGADPAVGESGAAGECDAAPAEVVADGGSEAVGGSELDRTSAPAAAPAPAAPARQAPPFWMVLAIAAVALVLGMVIGYLVGSASALSELSQAAPGASAPEGQDVAMPEGHPELEVDEGGSATVAGGDPQGSQASAPSADPLELANAHFDRGMTLLSQAQDAENHAQAVEILRQAVAYYDEYLEDHDSNAAEVDRAICVFYAGDHDAAIADLEDLVERDPSFAPAWANLGMFYEAHGDAEKAEAAYRAALDAAEKNDTYGVADYARERLEALGG